MTLNDVIALMLRDFTVRHFPGRLRHSGKDRPMMSEEYRLPLLAKTDPPCSAVSLRWSTCS